LPLLPKGDKSKVALVRVDCGKPNMKLKMYNAKAAQKRLESTSPTCCMQNNHPDFVSIVRTDTGKDGILTHNRKFKKEQKLRTFHFTGCQ